jgi:hypothetical protein
MLKLLRLFPKNCRASSKCQLQISSDPHSFGALHEEYFASIAARLWNFFAESSNIANRPLAAAHTR